MASNNPQNDDENKPLQDAIKASLLDSTSKPALKLENGEPTGSEVPEQLPPKRVNIDDRIKDMALRAALEMPLVRDPDGDTWVFIDPPPMQPEQDQLDYARYIKRYEAPILMKKDTLTKFSPFFEKAFEPTVQFRVVRRRNLVKELRMAFNVKYVIDLTPPSEGEEAVYLTTELCCSEGVRLWYQAGEIWRVSSNLVGGEEEYTSVKLQKPTVSFTPPSPTSASTCISLEYTPVRHRSAIERVLAALMGFDPKLDSAPKVWTTFAVAKYYEIKHSKLDDYIFSWLRAYPNSYFLEVLPEVSLQIAEGLENYELARDTFAILVGEEALDNLRRARIPNINNKLSTYGRKKEELPEHIHTRVEYASKSFLERIGNEFAEFAGDGMLWIENLPEFQKLESHTQPELQVTIQELKILLKDYVRGTIYNLLCVNYKSVPAQDLPHPGGKDLFPRMSRSDVWTNNLSINERILSRTFWQALSSFNLFEGRSNFDIKEGWGNQWDLTKLSNIEKDELNYGHYRQVETLDLKRHVREGNRLLDEGPSQPSFPLPIRSLPGAHVPSTESNVQLTDLMQSSQDSIGAQTTQLESNTPTQPINILQPSRNRRAIFDRDHTSMPDNRSIVQGRGAQWPFGAPRQDSALDVLRNMNDSYMSTMNHQMESGFPAPDGFSSWTISAITNDNKQVDKIDSTQQAEATGRSASIFTMRTEQVGNGLPHELPDSHDKTWSNPIRGTGEIDEGLSMQQPDPSGRSTPPFFRDDNALPQQSSTQNKKTKGPWSQPGVQKFLNLEEFFLQASGYITGFARNKLHPSDQFERPDPFELGITNTLVCLQDSEWKYLPLWAGGNDDGSGGVFNDQVPMADLGFSTAGPDVHTGVTPASSSRASSEFEVISSAHSDAISTFNTSMANNRGFSDHMHRGRVYAADTADAASSHQDDDSFTVVTDDDEEDAARRQLEAHERIEAAEEAAAKEARMIEKGKGTVEDENYADLFGFQDDEGDETERAEVGDFDDDEMDEDEDKSEDEDMVLV